MKKLILPLIFVPFLASAQNEMQISDHDIKSKFLTVVKDAEVEGMLSKTAEFNKCRDMNKFDPKQTDAIKKANLKAASDCFKTELAKNKDSKALQKLSENLQLQNYGLVKSKNISEITEYLSKKMHKALTGVDPDDKNPENQKWENQKIVDQKVFVDLYTNQLMKGALFEVSRFCFENLERPGEDKTDFATYWSSAIIDSLMKPDPKDGSKQIADVDKLSDVGSTSFFKISTDDLSKKENVYGDIKKGLSATAIDPVAYNKFFGFCQSALPRLCDKFKADTKVTDSHDNKLTDTSTTVSSGKMSVGANACLTMEKLKSIRTILANTEKVAKQFDEMGENKNSFALQMIKNPKIYQRGKGQGEDSLDELTSVSSADMLTEGQDDKLSELEKECAAGKGGSECDDFLVEGESLDKAIHNVESEMNLKREIEMARVKELAQKPDDLKKYLTDNGLFDLLAKFEDKANPMSAADIEIEIGKVYDARKVAEIESLKLKVGKRQVSEADNKTDADKNQLKADNIKETKEERARLAQVVMFNNIITSQLDLSDKDGNKVGRNVTGLNKELEGMGNSYDATLFSGIKEDAKKNGSKLDDISISGGGIIDSILGKAP